MDIPDSEINQIALETLIDNTDKIIKEVQTATRKWKEKYYGGHDEIPERNRRIAEIIGSMWGGREEVVELFSLVSGLELTIIRSKVSFQSKVCVVPTTSGGGSNGHNYAKDKPILFYRHNDMFVKMDGKVGNHLTLMAAEVRAATDEEIDEFIHSLSKNYPERLMEALT